MRLPSKLTPYNESVIATFPILLSILEQGELSPDELWRKTHSRFDDIVAYVEALDCLYALGKIELLTPDGVIQIVN